MLIHVAGVWQSEEEDLPASTSERAAFVQPLESIPLSENELRALQHNDAMAGGVIATILGLAFLVLLSLVIAVSMWTAHVGS